MTRTFADPRDAMAYALLVEIVACLVDSPERIHIEVRMREGKVYFGVHGDPKDADFLVAERGQLAEAIRTLMKALAQHSGRRYVVYFEPVAKPAFQGAAPVSAGETE